MHLLAELLRYPISFLKFKKEILFFLVFTLVANIKSEKKNVIFFLFFTLIATIKSEKKGDFFLDFTLIAIIKSERQLRSLTEIARNHSSYE